MANPLTSELDYLPGSSLKFSVRRIVDNYLYNHTGGAAGTFTASPSSSDYLASITEGAGDFAGTYPATIADVTTWDDGKYKFTFHDSLSGNSVIGSEVLFVADGAEVIAGTGGTGLDASGMRAALGMANPDMDTQLGGIQSDANDIQTRLPAALVSGRMDSSVGAMAANVLNAAAIAANAITAAKIAADAIGASQVASDAITEIQSGLSTLDAAAIRAAIGLAAANLDDQFTNLMPFGIGTVVGSPTPTSSAYSSSGVNIGTQTGSYVSITSPRLHYFTSGALTGQWGFINAHTYGAGTHAWGVTGFVAAPAAGDTFLVL